MGQPLELNAKSFPNLPTLSANNSARSLLGKLKAQLLRRSFFANVTMLAGGTALGQALVAVSSPILTRLYTPEDFGVLGVYTSIVSIMVVVASLRYEMAIPLAEDKESASNLLALAVCIVLGMSFFCGFGVWLLGEQIISWTNTPALKPYLFLLAPSLLGAGTYQVFTYWTIRNKRFGLLSYTKGLQATGQVGIQVAGGLLALGPLSLIVGYISSQFLGVGSLLKRSQLQLGSISVGKWGKLSQAYRNFPLFTTWSSLIGVVGIYAPTLLFAKYFALDIAGYFSLAMRVLGLPATLIGQAVSQVFYATVADKMYDAPSTRRLVEKLATSLFVISFTIFSVIGLHGPTLFAYVFGEDWMIGGLYAQYLAPWLMLSFVTSPLSTFALVKWKQREGVKFDLSVTGLRIASIWLGAQYASPEMAVGLFSVSGALIYLAYLAWILHLAGSSLIGWLRQIKVLVLISLSLLLALFAADYVLHPIAALGLSICALGLFNFWFWRSIYKETGNE